MPDTLYTQLGLVQPKPEKRIKLKGKKKEALNEYVYKRDNGRCLICGEPVPFGYTSHHIEYRSAQGNDTTENRATICMKCDKLMHGQDPNLLLDKIRRNFKAKHIIQFFLIGLVKVIERGNR